MSPDVRLLLREQWAALRGWIGDSGLLAHREEQSVLEAWNVHELVTHVGRSFLALTLLGPVVGEPMSLRQYVAQYGGAAQEIADGTKQLARSFERDLLGGIDNCARLGFRALDGLRTEVVRSPRGPIRLEDFVVTRLLELVVHGDDLGRSVPGLATPPLHDEAVATVSQVLADAFVEATGRAADDGDHLVWIRRATGRVASDDPALPLL